MKRISAGNVAAFIATALILAVMAPVILGVRMTELTAAGPAPEPIPPPENATPVEELAVDIWFLSQPYAFAAETIFADDLLETGDGYYIAFSEQGLNDYVAYWFADDFIEDDPNIRNPYLRLQPGIVSLEAEVNLRLGWQPVELVFQLNPDQQTLSFAGAWLGEQFYTTAPGSYLQSRTAELEEVTNRALTDLTFLHPTAGDLYIECIYIGEGVTQITAK